MLLLNQFFDRDPVVGLDHKRRVAESVTAAEYGDVCGSESISDAFDVCGLGIHSEDSWRFGTHQNAVVAGTGNVGN